MDFNKHKQCFLELLENKDIAAFVKRDTCGALCDKYHLTIVFLYFTRAKFTEQDYTIKNFFLALSLSHDLYDECKTLKNIITYYLCKFTKERRIAFHWHKLLLFEKMQFKGFVNRKISQKLCQMMEHKAFTKNRKKVHTGILRPMVVCAKCRCPAIKQIPSDISQVSSNDTDEIKREVVVEDEEFPNPKKKNKKLPEDLSRYKCN